jgi:hypothetical protein
MALALLLRIFKWCRKRLHRNQPSPPAPTGWALDPDLLSQDLRDPLLRQAYIDYLEACLLKPTRHRTK